MPIPSPQKDEEKSEFISRCMGDSVMNEEYSDGKQRAAVCFSQYKKAKKRAKGQARWEEQGNDEATIVL